MTLSVAGIRNGVILFIYDLCNDAVGSSDYVGPNSGVVNELELMYKEAAMTCFAVLYQHLSGDIEKNNETSYSG